MQSYLEAIEYTGKAFDNEPLTIDFIESHWGHAFNVKSSPQPWIHYGYGFYSGGQLLGTRRLRKGDVMLLKWESGRIGRFFIIDITHTKDPEDMFWAYIVLKEDAKE
jgi:hypothetical protein